MSLRVGMVICQENNPFLKQVVFAASWKLLRCSHEHTETVYLEVFHAECEQ